MTDKAPRTKWLLGALLGKDKADEVIADTVAATEKLEEAGIMPKELKESDKAGAVPDKKPQDGNPPPTDGEQPAPTDQTPPPPDNSQGGDMVAEVGTKLAQQIFDAAQGDLSKFTQEQLATVIADALRPAVEQEAPAPNPAPAQQPGKEQQMQDTNKSTGESEKAIGDLIETMVKDQGEMAKSYQAMTEEMATVKALVPVVQQLVATVEALNKQLSDRPRIASAAEETAIDKDSEAAKAIETAVKKSVGEQKKVLGLPVKE